MLTHLRRKRANPLAGANQVGRCIRTSCLCCACCAVHVLAMLPGWFKAEGCSFPLCAVLAAQTCPFNPAHACLQFHKKHKKKR